MPSLIRVVKFKVKVEGHVLISFGKNTKTATSCWRATNRRMLEPTKERYPTSKDKGGAAMRHDQVSLGRDHDKVKTRNCRIGSPQLGNTNTKEVLPLLWRFWVPCQASQPGNPAKGLGIPRESDFKDQWDLITGLSRDWEKQTRKAPTKSCMHQDPGERSSDPTGDGTSPPC